MLEAFDSTDDEEANDLPINPCLNQESNDSSNEDPSNCSTSTLDDTNLIFLDDDNQNTEEVEKCNRTGKKQILVDSTVQSSEEEQTIHEPIQTDVVKESKRNKKELESSKAPQTVHKATVSAVLKQTKKKGSASGRGTSKNVSDNNAFEKGEKEK